MVQLKNVFGNAPLPKEYRSRVIIYCLVSTLLGMLLTAGVFTWHYETVLDALRETHAAAIEVLKEQHAEALAARLKALGDYKDGIIEARNARIKTLEMENDALQDELAMTRAAYEAATLEHEDLFSVARRFWYVLRDAPEDSGLSLDLLAFSVECCRGWNVNPDLFWSMMKVTSDYRTDNGNNEGSTAVGLGAIAPSTGREIWEKTLGHGPGTFSRSMLADPYVNVAIAVAHVGSDLNAGRTLARALYHYGGSTFQGRVLRAARAHGFEIAETNAGFEYTKRS